MKWPIKLLNALYDRQVNKRQLSFQVWALLFYYGNHYIVGRLKLLFIYIELRLETPKKYVMKCL